MSEIQQLMALFIFLVVILACLLTYFYKRVRQDLQELSGRPNRYRAHHETSPRRALSAPDPTEKRLYSFRETSPHRALSAPDSTEKRLYSFRDAEFLLEPISENVIRVVYGDDVAYVGMNVDWNPHRPYCWTSLESQVYAEGIDASSVYEYPTIDEALEPPCERMLEAQRKRDAQRINPEERKAAVRRVMREFLDELPVGDPTGSGVRTETEADEAA